jgi:hypothetical protein
MGTGFSPLVASLGGGAQWRRGFLMLTGGYW